MRHTGNGKSIIAALLSALLLLSAAGCAGGNAEQVTAAAAGTPTAAVIDAAACAYVYEVAPAEGAEVDFHTALQRAFLDDPYVDGVIGTPAVIRVGGAAYEIDGNPYTSSDLETRTRAHDDWSRPDPVTLSWTGAAADSYFVQLSPDPDFAEDVRSYTTAETSINVYNLRIGTRFYWRIAPSEAEIGQGAVYSFSTSSAGPRNLYIDGVTNARDLGGYALADGSGRVRQGLLYRGSSLNVTYMDDDAILFSRDPDYFRLKITDAGLDTLLGDLGVKTELDLRVAGERNEIGNMNDGRIEGLAYVNIPLDYQGGEATANNLTRLDNPAQIKKIFELLADEDNYPVYFHCYIGTDRTGVISYLIGALCGMAEDDLYVNYVFSNFGDLSGTTSPAGRQLGTVTGVNGYGTLIDSYPGRTLSERTENALMDICGLSRETLVRVREILVEYD